MAVLCPTNTSTVAAVIATCEAPRPSWLRRGDSCLLSPPRPCRPLLSVATWRHVRQPPLRQPQWVRAALPAQQDKEEVEDDVAAAAVALVGEDAGVFDWTQESTKSWLTFSAVLAVVLTALYYLWLDPNTGFGGSFLEAVASLSGGSKEVEMLLVLTIFAIVHSGGAALRSSAEKVIGERAYRVLFAAISLPLAVSAVVFFITHRYDGVQLWQLRTVPGLHEVVWLLSFISFFFLYPSTFNLLEVAAVDKPKVHLWETGVMRITRHPQMAGQVIWCVAHTLWIGNTFTLVTSLGLCAHHAFGVWHGDQRLARKYGPAFEEVKGRTSIVPFAAIMDGRQKLPPDYYREFLRVPYFVIIAVTVGAYFSHPLMQLGSYSLHW